MICSLFNFCPRFSQSRHHEGALVGLAPPIETWNTFVALLCKKYCGETPWDHIFLHNNLFIRNFICSEINTFRLPKFNKISFVCSTLSLCKKWFYLKAI